MTIFTTVTQYFIRGSTQSNQAKGKKTSRLKRSKLFPFADDMTLCRKNTKKYIDTTRANKFRKATGYKINNKNQLYLFTLAMNNLKIKFRKQFNLKQHQKE